LSTATDAAGRVGIAALDAALAWRYTDEAVQRVLASPIVDRAVAHALRGPLVEAIARDLTRYAVVERVADESRLLDTIVDRLLESDELWLMVEEIAGSPAVTEAIAQQSVGFADHVAGSVRERSRTADAKIERAAWSLLRRRSRDSTVEGGPAGAT
jgi:hypothetical protein